MFAFVLIWNIRNNLRFKIIGDVLQKAYVIATTNYLLAPSVLNGLVHLRTALSTALSQAFLTTITVYSAKHATLYDALDKYLQDSLQLADPPSTDLAAAPQTYFTSVQNLAERVLKFAKNAAQPDHFFAAQATTPKGFRLCRKQRAFKVVWHTNNLLMISKDASNTHIQLTSFRGGTDALRDFADTCLARNKPSDFKACVYRCAPASKTGCSSAWEFAEHIDASQRSNFCYVSDDAHDVFTLLLEDLRKFLSSKDVYKSKDIAYRRGYLLHGPPGTGKTTLIKLLAMTLKLHLCVLDLSEAGLDDAVLRRRVTNAPKNSIVVLEDADSALTRQAAHAWRPKHAFNKTDDNNDDNNNNDVSNLFHKPSSGVTLSGILNVLDGQMSSSQESGQVFMLTTNFKDVLPKSMIRPGRCDVDQKIDLASSAQLEFVFKKFFPDCTEDDLATLHSHIKPLTRSVADLQGICMSSNTEKQALDNLHLLNEQKAYRFNFFEFVASIGLHKTWHALIDLGIESMDDLDHLSSDERTTVNMHGMDVAAGSYHPRIAARFNLFCKKGLMAPRILALSTILSVQQVAAYISKEFLIARTQAYAKAQEIKAAFANLTAWQLRRAASLCPRKIDRLYQALEWTVVTKKQKREFETNASEQEVTMKDWCWRAGVYDTHTKFGSAKYAACLAMKAETLQCTYGFGYTEALSITALMTGTERFGAFVRFVAEPCFLSKCCVD